jgi:hypothetical protein
MRDIASRGRGPTIDYTETLPHNLLSREHRDPRRLRRHTAHRRAERSEAERAGWNELLGRFHYIEKAFGEMLNML